MRILIFIVLITNSGYAAAEMKIDHRAAFKAKSVPKVLQILNIRSPIVTTSKITIEFPGNSFRRNRKELIEGNGTRLTFRVRSSLRKIKSIIVMAHNNPYPLAYILYPMNSKILDRNLPIKVQTGNNNITVVVRTNKSDYIYTREFIAPIHSCTSIGYDFSSGILDNGF